MPALINYVCWTPQVVSSTIATEAASPSDAVLLATHTPLRITRRGEGEAASSISESDLIDEFLNGHANDGVRIAPVLGQSGSGKSHLVRWVRAKLPSKPGRHVIYLAKARTSLRDVVEALLLGKHGPQFDEIRAQLSGLRESAQQDSLENRLLNELAEAVRSRTATDFMTKSLVGDRGLYVLFHDPLFREYMLRPGAFVPRRVEHFLKGRDLEAEDVPAAFSVEDLPLGLVNNPKFRQASAVARDVHRSLDTDTDLQALAVDLLNEVFDSAVMEAANIGVGSIQKAFLALREQLVGQEIVLLIEDFALIQGIRRDLLEAIIQVSRVDGVDRYATVRTMMAVTSGYYDALPDTFRTRAAASSPAYVVDVSLDDPAASGGPILVNFLGRYLNAARLGTARLEAEAGPTNACIECPLMGDCHATFGASADGFGLYPYNEPAIRRAVAITAEPDRRNLFNPRRVLSRMVRAVLTDEAAPIRDGVFPSPNFLREDRMRNQDDIPSRRLPDLTLPARTAISDRFDEPERTRYLTTFQFWGGVSPALPSGIYQAFSLPPVTIEVGEIVPRKRVADPAPQQDPSADVIPEALRVRLEEVDNWSKGSPLVANSAQIIRGAVRRALVADLNWTSPLMEDVDSQTLTKAVPDRNQISRSVSIEGPGENLPKGVLPIVRFARTDANATLFQSILLFAQTNGRLAPEALVRLREIADAHRPEIVRRVIEAAEFKSSGLVEAAASLIAGAALCGQLPTNPKLKDYVAAALWSGDRFVRSDTTRHAAWSRAESAYLIARRDAVGRIRGALGVTQGVRGGVHAIDDPRAQEVVRAAVARVDSVDPDALPTWCRPSEKARTTLQDVIPTVLADWEGTLRLVRKHVPVGASFASTVDAVLAATDAGRLLGLVTVSDLNALDQANRDARLHEFSAVTRLESVIAQATSAKGIELAGIVGAANGDVALAIRDYLSETSEWVEEGIRRAQTRVGTGSFDVDDDLASVLADWMRSLDAAEEAGNGG